MNTYQALIHPDILLPEPIRIAILEHYAKIARYDFDHFLLKAFVLHRISFADILTSCVSSRQIAPYEVAANKWLFYELDKRGDFQWTRTSSRAMVSTKNGLRKMIVEITHKDKPVAIYEMEHTREKENNKLAKIYSK